MTSVTAHDSESAAGREAESPAHLAIILESTSTVIVLERSSLLLISQAFSTLIICLGAIFCR
ncbi:hypothetical protein PGTUg99_021336 [Puccinia graminis f. sp. tritici]|uniref:Uncharacterized protein n=1 Tax=Puccinia graminis f. sp. tritici TaxID=56615 RepID=A0A5B0RND2_PUCGR|nr:hypothetical protein PGTUg99_021336 [Puccinia graminis f. sp. tritici]